MICYAESLTFSSTLVWFLILCCVRDHVKSHGDLVKSSRDTDITMRGRYPDKLEELARTATNQYAFMSPFFSRQGISSSQMNVALVNFQLGKLGLNSTTNPEMASAMLNGIKRAFRNLKIARKTNVCRKPVKVVVCVDDLLMNTNSIEIDILNNTKTYTAANAKELSLEMYQPRCLLVKRCSNTTGCCDSNSACVPKTVVTKKKSFFKFQRTDKSPLLMFEKTVVISYEEHKQSNHDR